MAGEQDTGATATTDGAGLVGWVMNAASSDWRAKLSDAVGAAETAPEMTAASWGWRAYELSLPEAFAVATTAVRSVPVLLASSAMLTMARLTVAGAGLRPDC